jgi:hypothetical protein
MKRSFYLYQSVLFAFVHSHKKENNQRDDQQHEENTESHSKFEDAAYYTAGT